jgi:hypothetical protein
MRAKTTASQCFCFCWLLFCCTTHLSPLASLLSSLCYFGPAAAAAAAAAGLLPTHSPRPAPARPHDNCCSLSSSGSIDRLIFVLSRDLCCRRARHSLSVVRLALCSLFLPLLLALLCFCCLSAVTSRHVTSPFVICHVSRTAPSPSSHCHLAWREVRARACDLIRITDRSCRFAHSHRSASSCICCVPLLASHFFSLTSLAVAVVTVSDLKAVLTRPSFCLLVLPHASEQGQASAARRRRAALRPIYTRGGL